MVGSYARLTPLAAVGAGDLDEVEFILDQAQHKTGEMVLGHEITHRRRQEQRLINLPGAKCLAHETRQNLTRSPLASKKCILSGQAPRRPSSSVRFSVSACIGLPKKPWHAAEPEARSGVLLPRDWRGIRSVLRPAVTRRMQ